MSSDIRNQKVFPRCFCKLQNAFQLTSPVYTDMKGRGEARRHIRTRCEDVMFSFSNRKSFLLSGTALIVFVLVLIALSAGLCKHRVADYLREDVWWQAGPFSFPRWRQRLGVRRSTGSRVRTPDLYHMSESTGLRHKEPLVSLDDKRVVWPPASIQQLPARSFPELIIEPSGIIAPTHVNFLFIVCFWLKIILFF